MDVVPIKAADWKKIVNTFLVKGLPQKREQTLPLCIIHRAFDTRQEP
jgi:hypothetical protein